MESGIPFRRKLRQLYVSTGDRLRGTGFGKVPGLSYTYRKLEQAAKIPNKGVAINYEGASLHLDPSDYIGERLYEYGEYEPEVTNAIKEHLSPGGTAIDIGAHIGHHTVSMRQAVGGYGRVIAFEPFPNNVDYIADTVDANNWDNVDINQIALSDSDSVESMTVPDDENTGRVTFNRGEANEQASSIQVETKTLSGFLTNSDIDNVDLVKMDIEGGEYRVLKDMADELDKIETILLEIHTTILSADEVEEVYRTLSTAGELTYYDREEVTAESLKSSEEKQIIWKQN